MWRWRVASVVASKARRLRSLADRLQRMTDALWKPISRDEALRRMAQASPDAVGHALETVRRGLQQGVVPSRVPLHLHAPEDLAGLPSEILLDLYAAEVASALGWAILGFTR